ncbi:hypothetical protein FXO38_18275 [Capsicum annuum]|nr:hypothetical protein FXO38_18275 [Capsicum annuum]
MLQMTHRIDGVDAIFDAPHQRPVIDIHTHSDSDLQGFEDFSTVLPIKILKKIGLSTNASASQPTKRRRTVRFDAKIVKMQYHEKIPSTVLRKNMPIDKTPTSVLEHVDAPKTTPSSSGKSIHEATSEEKWDEIKSFLQSYDGEEANIWAEKGAFNVSSRLRHFKDHDVEGSKMGDKPSQEMVNEMDIFPIVEDKEKMDHKVGGFKIRDVPSQDNVEEIAIVTTLKDKGKKGDYSSTIRESTQADLDVIMESLKAPVDDLLLEVIKPSKEIANQYIISDSQIPPDFPNAVVVAHQAAKPLAHRAKLPGRNQGVHAIALRRATMQCPICHFPVTWRDSDISHGLACGPSESWPPCSISAGLCSIVVVIQNEEAIINIIKGFCIPAGLSWYLVDEVYVPVNCNEKSHWIFAIVALKDRCIHVCDSLSNLRNMKSSPEIHWAYRNAYREKMSQRTRYCRVFVVGYGEYLSEEMDMPSVGFEAEYHRMRYASLLQNYGLQKVKKCYVSDNDDPPRPRIKILPLPDESEIVSIE